MSTKHVRTGSDVVRFGCGVKIECTDCGAARTFTPKGWVMAAGPKSLELARRRLKCSRCGGKAAKLVVLSPVAPAGRLRP